MLDCQASSNNKNNKDGDVVYCKYCQETGDSLGNSPTVYWGIQLDQDLLETIISIYPEWFKDYNLNLNNMAEGNTNNSQGNSSTTSSNCSGMSSKGPHPIIPLSPPKAEVDETPIQKTMDKNKESLKVKLMLRRPINQLVDQGIMPPLKTPPAYHEQRQKLERAKMGDILKSKIQRRPDRQELIQQHILEDSNVDPSLQDRQRQLKKARLADDLNDRLSHRPGPLELIEGNILKTDEQFAQAVKEGQIAFRRTCEGETRKHPPPVFVFEEDSSSEGALSPLQDSDQSQVGSVQSSFESNGQVASPSLASSSAASSLSPLSSVSSPSSFTLSPGAMSTVSPTLISPSSKTSSIVIKSESKDQNRNRKKSKSKSQPKARTIKFHEYKGPPSAQKNQQTSSSAVQTSYELLLQQQQLFLQWQLELHHKFPQIILPAAQKNNDSQTPQNALSGIVGLSSNVPNQVNSTPKVQQNPSQPETAANCCLSKLEDMKVSDLKAELKKRNLPVSGSKPQLIERLKPYSDVTTNAVTSSISNMAEASSTATVPTLPVKTEPALSDSGSQHATDDSVAMDTPMSPVLGGSEPNNNDLSTQVTPENSLDEVPALCSYKSAGPNGFNAVQQVAAGGDQRPPSVAPMEVDANSNAGFDSMDISEIRQNLPPVSTCVATTGTPTFISSNPVLTSSAGMASNMNKPAPATSPSTQLNEEFLKKKIQELQRELQLECEVWQLQEETNNQFGFYPNQAQRSQLQLQQQQQTLLQQQQQQQQQQLQLQKTLLLHHQAFPNAVSTQLVTDPKLHQKLVLQQHLQQKIQQQQLNQMQKLQQQNSLTAIPTTTVANTNAKASLAAFLQNQTLVTNPVANQVSSQPKTFFNSTPVTTTTQAAAVTSLPTQNSNQQQQQQFILNHINTQKQRSASVPNGITHQRTASLPNFRGLITPTGKAAVLRTPTDPQFVITKPPPNYDEATKQLHKVKQFVQGLQNNIANPPTGQKSVKSQAVDDVLEILIKNGELPPSAAQDPATPTTPKSLPSSLLFPGTQPIITANSTMVPSSTVTMTCTIPVCSTNSSSPPPSIPPPPPLPAASTHNVPNLKLALTSPPASVQPPSLGDVGLGSPDLDVTLDLDGLEAMDISQLTTDMNSISAPGNPDLADAIHMDIDMTDWLDAMLPVSSTLTTPVPNETDMSDPLLSNSQDPFELFNIDESDFRAPSDLSVLNWDKVDFAT